MERLVDQSIIMGPLKIFPLEQHAYRRGRSSETALHDLVSRIGAFDNTSFEAMSKKKADHEMHFTTLRWIAAMLSNRMVRAEIRGVSSTMMVRRDGPQEGVLSPLL
jgi:hypothetical protein